MMTPDDLQKYSDLLLKLYELQDRVRKNPPDQISDYAAVIMEISVVTTQIYALITNGQTTMVDIEAAHARNQQTWDVPGLPPLPVLFPYNVELQFPPLTTDEAHLIQPSDIFYRRKDTSVGWIVTQIDGPVPDPDVWEVMPR